MGQAAKSAGIPNKGSRILNESGIIKKHACSKIFVLKPPTPKMWDWHSLGGERCVPAMVGRGKARKWAQKVKTPGGESLSLRLPETEWNDAHLITYW